MENPWLRMGRLQGKSQAIALVVKGNSHGQQPLHLLRGLLH
jgi:hypothetical protein